MALIDFKCTKCGKKFFEIIKPSEIGKIKCPDCGGDVKRVYEERSIGKHSNGGSSGCGGNCSACSGCH